MTADDGSAAALVARASAVLLDFDGPICQLFADVPASAVAADLRRFLKHRRAAVPDAGAGDPLAVLRASARLDAATMADLHVELMQAELLAVRSAVPTPDADVVIRSLAERGHKLAVVSNNSERAIDEYLALHGLQAYVAAVSARASAHPLLMKPNPHLVTEALSGLNVLASDSVFVGDSVADVEASITAGVPCIGYANKPGKAQRLADAGAAVIVASMAAVL